MTIKETYKGFYIVCDCYTDSNYYFCILKDGKIIVNTLWNDDKMWDVDNVLAAAKKDIDNFLSGQHSYLKLFSYVL